jgi:MoaA/NifB/PqqE/SkfB family radical SAM enzyme
MFNQLLRRVNERHLPSHLFFGPTHVVLGVNNFCNLRCVMCDVGTGNDETNFGANLVGAKSRSMPFELFRRIADEMAEYCPTAHLAFSFTEPLAWQPLGDAFQYARARGLSASVTTNGLLLPRRAAEIVAGGCVNLSVSLDGPAAIHDRIRRRAGSFAKAVEGIRLVAAMEGAPGIGVFCTITEWNVGYLRQFLRDMSELPLKRVGLMHNNFVTGQQAHDHNALFGGALHATSSNVFESDPTKIDLQLLSVELTEIVKSKYPFPVTLQPNRTEVSDLATYYLRPEVFIGRRCHDATRILMIDPDGEAIPVHGRCFRFPIANIRTHSIKQIWNHEKQSELRRTLRRAGGLLPACSRCCSGFGSADAGPSKT